MPSSPRSPVATPAHTSIRTTWAAPTTNGGSTIDRYAVQRSTTAAGPWVTIAFPTTLAYTNTGLTNGARYYYRILAHNAAGWGAASTVVTATVGTPTAPRSVVARPGNTSVRLTWTAPWSTGGASIDRYAVQRSSDNRTWSTIAFPTALAYTNTGLTNGARYYYRVLAHNRFGYGPGTTTNAVPRTLPSAPRSPAASPGNGNVTVTWSTPSSNGGAAIDTHAVQHWNGTGWVTIAHSSGLTYTSTGLTNGRAYQYRVLAHNAAGWGPASPTVSATPRTVPSAPRSLAAAPGVRQVTLSWQSPASNGGATVDSYAVQRWDGTKWITIVTLTGRVYTNTGLANGVTNQYRVIAHNAAGWGATSAVATATTSTVPGAPTGATATPGNQTVTLTWQPPASDGGSAVIGYDIWNYQTGVTVRVQTPITSYTASGLQNGTSYFFTIRAVNDVGSSSYYAAAQATPATVPGLPPVQTHPLGHRPPERVASVDGSRIRRGPSDHRLPRRSAPVPRQRMVGDLRLDRNARHVRRFVLVGVALFHAGRLLVFDPRVGGQRHGCRSGVLRRQRLGGLTAT